MRRGELARQPGLVWPPKGVGAAQQVYMPLLGPREVVMQTLKGMEMEAGGRNWLDRSALTALVQLKDGWVRCCFCGYQLHVCPRLLNQVEQMRCVQAHGWRRCGTCDYSVYSCFKCAIEPDGFLDEQGRAGWLPTPDNVPDCCKGHWEKVLQYLGGTMPARRGPFVERCLLKRKRDTC